MAGALELHIDMSEIMGFAKALEQAPGMVAEEQRLAMQKSLDVLEQTIVPRTPVGVSGNLRGSVDTEIRGTPASLQGEIFTPLIYGLPVEHGRKKGKQPPTAAIELWVVRKLGIPAGREARSAAFVIARAIAAGQTKHQLKGGSKMFEEGFDAAEPIIVQIWEGLPDKVFNRLARA